MLKIAVSTLAVVITLSGCANSTKKISPTYVSPIQYSSYNCNQLAAESRRLNTRVSELGGTIDKAASNDAALTGVALVLFWPAAFALGGNESQEAEYAKVTGEREAVHKAMIAQECSLPIPPVES